MTHSTPSLNPRRGLMIEKAQPFDRTDLGLARRILAENDELIVGIGSAGRSHEPGAIMTAGERVELTDATLRADGIDPARYTIIPVEDQPEATQWVAEVLRVTPRWQTLYTRNFKNASMFDSFRRAAGITAKTIEEQKPAIDLYKTFATAHKERENIALLTEIVQQLPAAGLLWTDAHGILDRIDTIYNRVRHESLQDNTKRGSRALFLGGLRPPHGVYADGTGHLGAIKQALDENESVVIAIGSAQKSHDMRCPLTAGERIDVIRYALLSNGVPAERLSFVPINDIAANANFAYKVVAMSPAFDTVVAGNDWTKQLFAESKYRILPLTRSEHDGAGISSTRVREIVSSGLKAIPKQETVPPGAIDAIEKKLAGMVDPALLEAYRAASFYERMHFLTHAEE